MNPEVSSEDRVEFAAKQLLVAVETGHLNKVSARQTTLGKMKDAISKARTAGFSHARIATSLTSNGVTVTRYDVARFCIESLGEAKPKKRRKQTASKPKAMAKETKEVDPAPHTTPIATHPAQNSRPGFRVARDEDL